MPTIQVRNVPEDVHRAFRKRAAASGRSLQEYLLEELTVSARSKTPAEIVQGVRNRLRVEGAGGFAATSSAAHVRADRDAR